MGCTTQNVIPTCSLSILCAPGYELLFQPEVVRIYTSLLKESQNPTVLEASAGAVQNLCAGRWTVSGSVSVAALLGSPFHVANIEKAAQMLVELIHNMEYRALTLEKDSK